MPSIRNTLCALAAVLGAALAGPAAAEGEQFVSILSFRVGPYGPAGTGVFGGLLDYLSYLNLKDGGVDGVKLTWEECETEYQAAKGVECYERLKTRSPSRGTLIHPVSTPISYALLEKTAADKVPLAMMGHGRTDAVDGRIFPWAFPLITTYPMQATAIVSFIAKREKQIKGKRIAYVYLDSAYGKEPIRYLQAEAKTFGFELSLHPVAPPGNEQGAQWQEVRQSRADWVILWGFGVMNPTAIKTAAKVGFPRDHMIGSWWAGSEEDTVPAGDAAKGYLSAALNVSGKTPLISDIEKVVYGAGKGNLPDKAKIGTINHNRGVILGILTGETLRTGHRKFGKRPLTGEEVRWALEHLEISDARLKELGASGLMPSLKISCTDHEGSGRIKIQQWDGSRWNVLSDWIDGNRALVRPLLEESAAAYAREKGITPRDCSKES